jgi:hypothetical protein
MYSRGHYGNALIHGVHQVAVAVKIEAWPSVTRWVREGRAAQGPANPAITCIFRHSIGISLLSQRISIARVMRAGQMCESRHHVLLCSTSALTSQNAVFS